MAKDWHGSAQRRFPLGRWVAITAIGLFTALAIPFAHHYLGRNGSFTPSILTLTTVASAFAAFLLFQEVLFGRDGRLAGIGAAFLFSGLSIIPVALSTPHVWTGTGLLEASRASAPMFWVVSKGGFALLIIGAYAFTDKLRPMTVTKCGRRKLVALSILVPLVATLLSSAVVVWLAAEFGRHSNNPSIPTTSSSVVLGLNIAAFVMSMRTHRIHTLNNIIPVAIATSLVSVAMTGIDDDSYTVGWYFSYVMSMIIAAVVVGALMMNIVKLYRQSEHDKHVLEDEALHLLKETRAAQGREDRVRRIIENAADAYIEIDRAGVIQAWNSKAAEMFGWSAGEAIANEFASMVMAEAGRSQLLEFLDEFWTDNSRFDGARAEIIAMNREGEEFPVEASVWVDESDSHRQMNFFLRDISSRRGAEEQLQRALEDERQAVMQLQELDRAKTDFVSSVSHELRSPLTSTLGFLELLADGEAGQLSVDQMRMVNIASRNARRLFLMIEDLLTLSRIEENSFRVSYKPVRIESLLETVLEHNQVLASERGISMDLDAHGPLGVCAGDEQQLARAIDNIVGNAVKFTPPGGKVSVRVRRSAEEVVMTVSDTGIGIPIDEQSNLFTRFFRASVAIEQQHQGTGLGLTIAKAIIDHHNGSINVESQLGVGTTVTVRCPALPIEESINLATA